METRVERYRRRRRERFFRTLKFIIIMILVSSMSYGLFFVNQTIKDFHVIENDNLLEIDINKNRVDLLGKSYYIDFQRIKNVFTQ